jgi:hypothetical protein
MSMQDQAGPIQQAADAPVYFRVFFYLACIAFLYLHLFILPVTPIYYESDQVNLLNDAKRFAEGEMIYRDFFEFIFPGSHTFFAFLILIFGPKYWIMNVAILGHGLVAVYLGVLISRKLFSDPYTAYLPSAIFLFFGFRWFGIDGEHRMFSPLFVYLAILALLTVRNARTVAIAGVCCALTSFITQQRGFLVATGVGLFLFLEFVVINRDWRQFLKLGAVLSVAFLGVFLTLISPYALLTGPEKFFTDTILFIKAYASDPNTNSFLTYFTTLEKIRSLGTVWFGLTIFYTLLIPLVYLVAMAVAFLKGRREGFAAVAPVLVVCFVGFFVSGATTGPNVFRLFQVAVPATITLLWLINLTGFLNGRLARTAIVLLAGLGLALGARVQAAWDAKSLDTASGRIAFLSPVIRERYEWLLERTQPGDMVYETYNAHVNFPLGLKNPTRMSILLNTGYSPPEHVAWAIEDLKRSRPKYIIWDGAWTDEVLSMSEGERLRPLYDLLLDNYRPVKYFTPYDGRKMEMWERVEAAQ